MNFIKTYIFLFVILLLVGCVKDPKPIPPPDYLYNDGVLIANEGPFGSGSGTVSFYKRDGSALKHNIFQEANYLQPLGNIVQSLTMINNKVYVLVNNANKIEVVNARGFQSIERIEDIESPRFMIESTDSKAYITSWDGKIKVLDTESNLVHKEIETSVGQERMLKIDNKVWVLNQGGLGIDSTISVVNLNTDEVIETISVFPRPSGICQDKNGLIWVMCSGRLDYHPGGISVGHLIAINKTNFEIVKDFVFPVAEKQPLYLQINNEGDELYYIYPGGINRFSIDDENINLESFISYSGSFYSFGYDAKEKKIYAADALDYSQKGQVFVYDANTGEQTTTFKAGIIPAFFYFSE